MEQALNRVAKKSSRAASTCERNNKTQIFVDIERREPKFKTSRVFPKFAL